MRMRIICCKAQLTFVAVSLTVLEMAKRSVVDAFGKLESLKESPNAKMRGVVTSLSEMRKSGSCSYWEGDL